MSCASIQSAQSSSFRSFADASSEWAAEVVEELCDRVLEQIENINEVAAEEKDLSDVFYLLHDLLRALYGKGGAHGCECYRKRQTLQKIKPPHNFLNRIMLLLTFLKQRIDRRQMFQQLPVAFTAVRTALPIQCG